MSAAAKPRSRALPVLLALPVAVLLGAVVAAYFVNPLGTASRDVRARLLGFMVYRTASASMAPTLAPGDVVLLDTRAYWREAPAPGDVVVFFPPANPGRAPWISRVAAVGGARVEVRQGRVFVDGQAQPMPPGVAAAPGPGRGRDTQEWVVPPGEVFVLGDNRDHAMDSRYFGTVPRSSIVGRMAHVARQPWPWPARPLFLVCCSLGIESIDPAADRMVSLPLMRSGGAGERAL